MAYNSQYTGAAFDKAMAMALNVGETKDLETNDRTTIVNAINELNDSSVNAATRAERSAAKAERYVEELKEVINDLPEAENVSAQVAENTANILLLQEAGDLITIDEYRAIMPKQLRYYQVARDEEDKEKRKCWRIYYCKQLVGEFRVDGLLTLPKFPMRFPFRLA